MSESTRETVSVGTRVIDTEDDDPSVEVVVWRPPAKTIADWEFTTDDARIKLHQLYPVEIEEN